MQLYFAPFACSTAVRIAAYETDAPLEYVKVSLSAKRLEDGSDYLPIAPKGQVPALRLGDGFVLTEVPAVLAFLAERDPASRLLAPAGDPARYAALSWTAFVSTEIHKAIFWTSFNPDSPPEAKAYVRGLIPGKLAHLERRLSGVPFLAGEAFSIADAYAGWALALMRRIGVDLAPFPAVAAYQARLDARPAVARAFADEMAAMAA